MQVGASWWTWSVVARWRAGSLAGLVVDADLAAKAKPEAVCEKWEVTEL